ncbi:MAG TPA: hypothetical protein PLC24_04295 [Myxococcota bacterium]|nr:hypothetical protein [Myxococcota bacterium]
MGNRGNRDDRFGMHGGRHGDWPGKPCGDMRDDWPGRPHDDELDGYGCPEFGFRRHFITRAEKLEALNDYLEELENEAEGVREAIDELLDQMIEAGDFDDDDFEDDEDDEIEGCGCGCCDEPEDVK